MTLRDETGVIQLISEDIESFKDITRESTMTVTGTVRHRAEGMTNPNMKTGEVEVLVSSFEVLGETLNVLPFEINRSTDAFEDTRLKYRYLDLRNPKVHDRILFRTEVLDYMRKIMKEMKFTEIQTQSLQLHHQKEQETLSYHQESIKENSMHYLKHRKYLNNYLCAQDLIDTFK